MAKPSPSLELTCPVCGEVVVAPGTGALSSFIDEKGDLTTLLSYTASTRHDCPGIDVTAMGVDHA
jgi:hypothetical protein